MEGRSLLVTGAARGIGLACARMAIARGARVIAADIDAANLRIAFPEDSSHVRAVPTDVRDPESCARAVEAATTNYGALDAVLHLAVKHSSARWDELGAQELGDTLAVNVVGSHLVAQAAARVMVARGRGSIVLCMSASVLYGITGGDGQGGPAYVASKSAIIGLTRSMARALGPTGVRVNAISPGLTETPLIANYSAEKRAAMLKRFPMGRFAAPEEIAAAALFLASDDASFMTGTIMHANGGSDFA